MLSAGAAQFMDKVLDLAQDSGVPVLFDPNVRLRLGDRHAWQKALGDILGRVDTLLIGDDELRLLGLPDDAARLVTARTATVVVKHGAGGATAFTSHATVHQPAREVPLADPVGAGDAFCAGWISASLRGATLQQSLREATVVASFAVANTTDTAGLPSADERDLALDENGADVDR
jgi:2-dehydro-3-deoxygluconokinase